MLYSFFERLCTACARPLPEESPVTQLPDDLQSQRDAFHDAVKDMSIIPLWLNMGAATQSEPKVEAVPHIWRWRDIKPMMVRGGELISP